MTFFSTTSTRLLASLTLATGLGLALSPAAVAQNLVSTAVTTDTPVSPAADAAPSSSSALPDAPSTTISADDSMLRVSVLPAAAGEPNGNNEAPKYAKYIASNERAQKINAHDKVVIGLRDLYSPENFLGIVFSAGYEQLVNGEPNYGSNSKAFGQRIGAAAVRETSQGLFTDVVFSPLLHMDPRYYAAGPQTGFVHRTVYAVTRVLVSKTDSGRETVNAPLLLGYAATSAMTPLYYPQINRNFKDVATGYGGSLGGAAIGFLFSEFSNSILQGLHMQKKP